jgi:catechol 2,3-dioxygenase
MASEAGQAGHAGTVAGSPIDPRVGIGHVHLKVADLERAISFYRDVLGFELMQRYGDQAAFLSAGGYHHHIGLNTWHSAGAAPAPTGAVGLRSFAVDLPDERALAAVLARVKEASLPSSPEQDGVLVRDPFGSGVVLRTPTSAG